VAGAAVILDTHAWLRYLGAATMEKSALRRIERARATGRLQIAAITLWEVALLEHERKLRFDEAVKPWLETALVRSGVTVVPLDAGVAYESARLIRTLRDPADCQIAGTALHLGTALATRDARILEHAEGMGLETLEV
jgi:PIN domain nuclease of toxin-antitoxin system